MPSVEWKCKENVIIKSEIQNMAKLIRKKDLIQARGWMAFLITIILGKFYKKVTISQHRFEKLTYGDLRKTSGIHKY